jgi:hypothetical protein
LLTTCSGGAEESPVFLVILSEAKNPPVSVLQGGGLNDSGSVLGLSRAVVLHSLSLAAARNPERLRIGVALCLRG